MSDRCQPKTVKKATQDTLDKDKIRGDEEASGVFSCFIFSCVLVFVVVAVGPSVMCFLLEEIN